MRHNYALDIPRITGPFQDYLSSNTEIKIDETVTESDGSQLIRSHFWRRIFTTTIRCGDSGAVTITAKTGTSQATLAEVAGSLETSVYVLKSNISSKLSVTETLSEENTVQFVRNVAPKPCHAKRFAEWQRKERVTVRKPKGFFRKGFTEHHIDIGTTETYPDEFEYVDPDCCPDDFDRDIANGFDEVYTVTFGSYTSAMLAKTVFGGKVQFPRIPGTFKAGQVLGIEDFQPYLDPTVEISTGIVGTLSESLGPARAYFRLCEEAEQRSSTGNVPLMIGLICVPLVIMIFLRKIERMIDEYKPYDSSSSKGPTGEVSTTTEYVPVGRIRNDPRAMGEAVEAPARERVTSH